jgi:hypothetical protein
VVSPQVALTIRPLSRLTLLTSPVSVLRVNIATASAYPALDRRLPGSDLRRRALISYTTRRDAVQRSG